MYDRDNITKDDIKKFNSINCRNKIVLSNKEYDDIDYVIKINPTKKINGQVYLDRDILWRVTFEK